MKISQQDNAIKTMKEWLKNEGGFGKEPKEIEIAEIFAIGGIEYAILKFRKENADKWLYGLCGGYTPISQNHSGIIFSEFKEWNTDDTHSPKSVCLEYITNLAKKSNQPTLAKFVNWLKHPNELGKEPAEIEIDKIFNIDEYQYAIIKFKKENDSPWLFGVCNIEDEKTPGDGIVWSEFEEYNKDLVEEKCKNYIARAKQQLKNLAKNHIYDQINELRKNNDWQGIVDFVDKNIANFKQPQKADGVKSFQFPHLYDFLYFNTTHKNEKFDCVDNTEFNLLVRKMYAFVELKEYDQAKTLIDVLLELSPNYTEVLFEKIEIAKLEQDIVAVERLLNEVYPFVWYYKNFAKFLRLHAWLAIEKGDVKHAVNCLALSLDYNNDEYSFNYVNNELNYMQVKFNLTRIERPSAKELNEYFANIEYSSPTQENRYFCRDLYGFCLKNRDKYSNLVADAKNNLVNIYRGSPFIAKTVEVAELTPNFLVINFDYGFSFEVSKTFKSKEIDKKAHPNRLYEFVNDKNEVITILKCGKFTSEQQYEKLIEKHKKEHADAGFEVTPDGYFVGAENQIKATKVLGKGKKGNLFVVYWFKMSPNEAGRISALVKENHSELEGEMINILSTWQYLK